MIKQVHRARLVLRKRERRLVSLMVGKARVFHALVR